MVCGLQENSGVGREKMRICLLNRYFDARGTGVTRIATEVSRELEKQGHEVVKIATDGASLYAYAFQTAIAAPFKIPRRGIDVYHALATLEAMWLPPNRSIATYLDLFTTTNPDRAGAGMGYSRWKLEVGKRYFALGAKLAARCRFLVCISEKTKQDVIEHIRPDESKLRVIRLGVPDSLKPMDRKHSRLTIGTLGQLDKRKRIYLLIEAFRKSKLDADLLIAGQGPDRGILEDLAGGDRRIQFLGLVPEPELNSFYNSLNIFIFPTAIEGYGLPIAESAACGKPVVVLDDAILPTEVRSHCVSVPNLDWLFNKPDRMDSVLANPDRDNHLAFARKHRWNGCVAEYVKLYKEITEGK